VAIIIVILPNAITCALLLSESTRLMNPVTILLPLYTYPTKNAWEPLFNAYVPRASTCSKAYIDLRAESTRIRAPISL